MLYTIGPFGAIIFSLLFFEKLEGADVEELSEGGGVALHTRAW